MYKYGGKPTGLFINPSQANCSIYESGIMIYRSLLLSHKYNLDYLEIEANQREVSSKYDFYAFNYHYLTMGWLDTESVRLLPRVKITFVLEMLPNNPFVLCPERDFDAYCVLDPTMNISNKRVYAFPRPLEVIKTMVHFKEHEIPVIGSFGFATPGKGFENVVDAVNKEFDRAIIRINMPLATYADDVYFNLHNRNYADHLGELCQKNAKAGIRVVVTHDYMTKKELIEWCAKNTLNCFLYDRNMPGLAATTDQAISSGRPLAISTNETFRHIHQYVEPYPMQSLRESIASSQPRVGEMQQAWSPERFAARFETLLNDYGILLKATRKESSAKGITLKKKSQQKKRNMESRKYISRYIDKARTVGDRFLALYLPNRKALCKFLKSKREVYICTEYLKKHGYSSHRLSCKDWDLANILNDLSDGNLLDMGSSDSYILKNAIIKGVRGEKCGIDLQKPDVPVSGVKYIVGDLLNVPLPDSLFHNICCLSVIEHDIPISIFALEVSRLLCEYGKVYLTFDYWNPKVHSRLRICDKRWNILDRDEISKLIEECGKNGLSLIEEVDWSLAKPVIDGSFYSPDPNIGYTFGMLVFQKAKRS